MNEQEYPKGIMSTKATDSDAKKSDKEPASQAKKSSAAKTKEAKSKSASSKSTKAPAKTTAKKQKAKTPESVNEVVTTPKSTTPSKAGLPKAYKQLLIGLAGVLILGGGAYAAMQNLDKKDKARTEAATVDLKTHTSKKFGITVKYPANWDATESDDDLTKTISFDERIDPKSTDEIAKLPAQIMVDIQEAGKDSAKFKESEFFDSLESNLVKNLGKQPGTAEGAEYAELISKEKVKVDGFNAYKVAVNINNYEGKVGEKGHGKLLFVFVNESKQVTLLYEGHVSDDAVFDSFDAVIESLDIT